MSILLISPWGYLSWLLEGTPDSLDWCTLSTPRRPRWNRSEQDGTTAKSRVNRVWGTCRFLAYIHHDGKISPGWWGWVCTPTHLLTYGVACTMWLNHTRNPCELIKTICRAKCQISIENYKTNELLDWQHRVNFNKIRRRSQGWQNSTVRNKKKY